MTFSVMILIVKLSIMTLGISINCHYAECCQAKCLIFYCYADCDYAECYCAECRGAIKLAFYGVAAF